MRLTSAEQKRTIESNAMLLEHIELDMQTARDRGRSRFKLGGDDEPCGCLTLKFINFAQFCRHRSLSLSELIYHKVLIMRSWCS